MSTRPYARGGPVFPGAFHSEPRGDFPAHSDPLPHFPRRVVRGSLALAFALRKLAEWEAEHRGN